MTFIAIAASLTRPKSSFSKPAPWPGHAAVAEAGRTLWPRRQRRSVHTGFTLVELLVVLGVIAALVGMLLPAMANVREHAQRAKCMSNLRQISTAAIAYATDNDGQFPRTYYQPNAGLANSCQGGMGNAPSKLSFNGDDPLGPVGGDNSGASLYLLLRYGFVTPEIFRCPSNINALHMDPGTVNQYANFPTPMRAYNSYSYAAQFPNTKAVKAGWHYSLTLNGDFPIASDINPGSGGMTQDGSESTQDASSVAYNDPPTAMVRANSNNHLNTGQNVAYVDGRVEWWTTPFCGPQVPGSPYRDNIFCNNNGTDPLTGKGGAVHGEPQTAYDVVMDPCDGAK